MDLVNAIILELGCDECELELISHYIKHSCDRIKIYLNKKFTDEFIKKNYSSAVIEICCKMYRNRKIKNNGGIKSMTQGQRSITYGDIITNLIDDEIKALLPAPFISVKG